MISMQAKDLPDIFAKIPEAKRSFIPVVEALIFSSESALSPQRIREILPDLTPKEISLSVDYLNTHYRETGRAFVIKEIAGGYQMFTLPEYAGYVDQLYQNKKKSRLSHKALETLAIIAYKQPITRHEIEEIRGVNVDGVVRTLLSRNLITIAGRAQAPGSPFLYKTTKKFLDYFGLASLSDLPKLKEIDDLINVDDQDRPYYETLLKEIPPDELGMKRNGNGTNGPEEGNGNEE